MSTTRHSRFSKKTIVISGAITIVVASLIVGLLIIQVNANKDLGEKPSYQTVLPEGKSVSRLGGWNRVSPASKDPIYAYTDAINGVIISVSQQPLPAAFKSDVNAQVSKMAEAFNATTKIDSGDTRVYLGTSAKGPQSVIFAKKDVLILIKSENKISNDAWSSYVQSLR